jgi:nitroreductase/NAD-dependent dihydropyrimidine dehydrogenase PreA subunit
MSNLLSIDESQCTRCGQCAAACPMGLVVIGTRFPRTLRAAEERCVLCGHCVAACPVQLLRHEHLPADPCSPLAPEWRGTPDALGQIIRGRRSIRHYRQDAVPKPVLLSVLDAARYAPTGMNSQSVKWTVVYDSTQVKKLSLAVIDWMRELMLQDQAVAGRYSAATLVAAWEAGLDPILRGCPHVLVACGAENDPMAPASCMIALTTADLAAQPLGLGTCWAGFLHLAANTSPAVRQALDLPAGQVMHGGLMIGYPAETYHCVPPRKPLTVDWR